MQDLNIEVFVEGEARSVRPGTPVLEVLGNGQDPDIVGALLHHDVVSLDFPLTVPVAVTPVRRRQREGREIIRRTATHMLESVLARHFPNLHFRIGQSLHQGYYYELLDWRGEEPRLEDVVAQTDVLLQDMVESNLSLDRREVTVEEACLLLADPGGSMPRLLDAWPFPHVPVVELCGFIAIQHGPFAPSTSYARGVHVVPFPRGMILQFSRDAPRPDPARSRRLVAAYRESREWNQMIGVATVGDLNEAILQDRIDEVIRVQEALHEKKIVQIADAIAEQRDRIRLVCVAGPSSSGKTTFVRRLSVQLQVTGVQPVIVGMDDYYQDRSKTPRDKDGNYDFEAVEALDVPLLSQHLEALVEGQEVLMPRFDFEAGQRAPESRWRPLRLKPNQILLIEGIHGLNPMLTALISPEAKYRIFVSALTQLVIDEHNRIPTTDMRLLRRIVRDAQYRGYTARDTIRRWESVRRGEERYIFPYQENADVMFNSALAYELAVLKPFAEPLLLRVPRGTMEYIEARRLLAFLRWVRPCTAEYVPDNSLLREFIGGSILQDFAP